LLLEVLVVETKQSGELGHQVVWEVYSHPVALVAVTSSQMVILADWMVLLVVVEIFQTVLAAAVFPPLAITVAMVTLTALHIRHLVVVEALER
jgi:hypothetical protein